MDGQNDSIVLEEEIDPNYEPTEREVLEYATWLGMDLDNETDLFWIAREGLKAPLPENWKPCKTTDTEEIYYFNFASGQSTWDHPCDEFYRNLYEENKKKRGGGGGASGGAGKKDTDERKKKEREDVAELLGRGKSGGSGKKKKGSLSRAEPLGPPTLGRGGASLDKKPLGVLSSKLGVLGAIGGSGPTVGGLKPASGLGRLRSESKDVDDSNRGGHDDSDDDEPPPPSLNALSKPPLGGLLTKKPLPSSAPSASLARRDLKAETDSASAAAAAADLEHKKQQLLDDHARVLEDITTSHEHEIEALKKKLQKQREALEDDEESELKQKKRAFDKKLHDLENQFDTDESTMLRERKDAIKRFESDAEAALTQKRQELDKELRSETERIENKHETKLRDLKRAHEQEERELEEKLAAALHDKTQDVRSASNLRSQVEKLTAELAALESELRTSRSELNAMAQSKQDAEATTKRATQEIEALQQQLTTLRAGDASASDSMASRIDTLTRDAATLESELRAMRNERDALQQAQSDSAAALESATREIAALQQQLSTRRTSDASASGAISDVIAQLTTEIAMRDAELVATRNERDALLEAKATTEAKLKQVQQEMRLLSTGDARAAGEQSGRVEQLTTRIATLESELDAARSENLALVQHNAGGETTNKQVERDLQHTQRELQDALMKQTQMQSELQLAQSDLEDAQNKLQDVHGQLDRSESDCKQAQSELKQTHSELQDTQNELTQAQTTCKQTQSALTQAQSDLEAMRAGDTSIASELSARAEKLTRQVTTLESELRAARSAETTLQQANADADAKLQDAEREARTAQASAASATSDLSSRNETLLAQLTALESELRATCDERNALLQTQSARVAELESTKRELAALQAGDATAASEMSSRIGQLTGELTALQQELAAARDIASTLKRSKLDTERALEHARHDVDAKARELEAHRLDATRKSASAAQELTTAHAATTRVENALSELQDELLVLEKTNAQIKEQLLKESHEKRSLREQLDSQVDQMSRELTRTIEQLQQHIAKLERDATTERATRDELQRVGAQLRQDKQELELVKRKSESDMARLESDKRHVESERALLARQLKELIESQRQQEQSSALEGHAELTKQKWEIEQLQTTLKVVESDKTRLDERVRQLEREVETLTATNHQLTEKARVGAYKTIELENNVKAVGSERDRMSEELQAAATELNKWKDRADAKQKELNQTMLSLRSIEAEKQLVDDALVKAKVEKSELAAQRTAAEKSVRLLKEQVESQRQQEQSSALEGHAELTKQKWDIEQLQSTLKAVESDKMHLDERVRQLETENEEVTATNNQLAEKARVGAYKTIELENKTRTVGMERERASEELQAAANELNKWKDRAEAKQREVNQVLATLRHAESERDLAKEALATEKLERDDVVSQKTGLEKSKKALENELASLRFERLSVETSQRTAVGLEAHCVKLQLADVNKSELEAHLADVASQLEVSTRRCASLDARCRDQAVDMESLHVEIASLRAATQKMHLSALETLPLVERLDYEHKKRVLKSDFQLQLRDFQEREDQALVRQKARLRAQCERLIDELVAELERKKRVRMEQEGALTLQMIEQVRQERDAKRSELKRQVRDELLDLERELTERKDHHLQTISDVMRKEEDALNARLRESRQALREEELVRAAAVGLSSSSSSVFETPAPLDTARKGDLSDSRRAFFNSGGSGTNNNNNNNIINNNNNNSDDDTSGFNAVDNNNRERSTRQRRAPAAVAAWDENRRSATATKTTSRYNRTNNNKSVTAFRKWSKRLEDENALLAKAKALVSNQRRDLKKRTEQLRRDKDDWRKDQQRGATHHKHHAILHEVKRMIEQNTATLNQNVRQLREREAWVKKREQNIAKMQRTVDKLRSRARRGSISNNKYNSGSGSGFLSDDDDDNDGLDLDEGVLSDGERQDADIESLLDTLEKLDDELVSEVGEVSEDLAGDTGGHYYHYNRWDELTPDAEHLRDHWPQSFGTTPEFAPPASGMWRLPGGGGGVGSASLSPYANRAMHNGNFYASYHGATADLYTPTAATRLFGGTTTRPYPQRMASLSHPRRTARSSLQERVPERVELFQRQISRWASDRAKVQHAATRHAHWLSGMCDELQEYGAKYQQDNAARQATTDATAAAVAITQLDDDNAA